MGAVIPQVVVIAGKVLDEEGKLRGLLLCAMAALKHLEILSEPSFWAATPLKSCQFSAYGCLAAKLELSGRMTAASVGSVVW